MAKHMVKCMYCGESFDASVEPFVKPNKIRYAHPECAQKKENEKTKEQKDREALETYIKELFEIKEITPKIKKQIDTYHTQYNYTFSGIHKTLKYWFGIRNQSLEKANDGIGIVPHIYNEAFAYWRAIWEAQQQNQNININDYVLPDREIHITPPQREPMKRMRKLFTFLDEEGDYE